ncbi:MAG: hypothetical protein ACK5EU_02995 [Pseudanabaena sp.]
MRVVPLNEHPAIIGLPPFTVKSLPKQEFFELLAGAGYTLSATMPSGKHNCLKYLFSHKKYNSVMAVYNPVNDRIVTAYQLD